MTLRRQLLTVLIATFAVVSIPLVTVNALEAFTGLDSLLLSAAAVVAVSFAVASAGAALWARHPGSRDLVFGDLMLWGWIRRLRTERRLAEVEELLGLGRSGVKGLNTELAPAEQTKLLERLASSLEARDPHTQGHTRRVTRYAEMIAQRMGLSPEQVAKVRTAAAIHDVGKIETPREVLNKPGKLTEEEFEVVKRHPVAGSEMVEGLGDPAMTAIVRHHHERLDGRGYPDRLSGDEIPLGARIVAVADTFDAITSSRPYRRGMVHRRALEILKTEAGSQLDPAAVMAFLGCYSGSRSASRWTLLISVPQRLVGSLREALQATAAAPLAQNAVAVAATAVLGSSLAAPIADAVHRGNSSQPVSAAQSPIARGDAGDAGVMAPGAKGQGDVVPRSEQGSAGLRDGARPGPQKSAQDNAAGAGSDQGATSEPASHTEPGSGSQASPGDGDRQGKADGRESAPERKASPERSGSAPGHARDKPTPPNPARDRPAPPAKVDKPAPPGNANPNPPVGGGPPADSPGNQAGRDGNGNGGKKS